MTDDIAIRDLQRTWLRATEDGDIATISGLMTDDVVFLTPGRPPFGRQEFIQSFQGMIGQVAMHCRGEYEEIIVTGDFAYARARLDITVTPKIGGVPKHLSGNTLSILRRSPNGEWKLCRDANLLTPADS
ncbi:MAG: SgcJ/EcaC family oxidoreductase [Planctomycetaceae bacterium]|nr:SgcJ/EcaC family oxidoreductase [Planctomycetaceae bacterium]